MVARLVTVISWTLTPLGMALGLSLSGVCMVTQHLCLYHAFQFTGLWLCCCIAPLHRGFRGKRERGRIEIMNKLLYVVSRITDSTAAGKSGANGDVA